MISPGCSGVDLTGIDAIGVETVQAVLSEYGPDLSRFPTEKQFVQHVTLAPHRPTSGGKPVKKKKRGSASTRVADHHRPSHDNYSENHVRRPIYCAVIYEQPNQKSQIGIPI